ncbi:glycerophosphoryl diester phosphodiesterase [Microbacterium resistens]|uniref:Glycerophosphoryl diester phosphodiesterase n=1 Tax=Microbacterium resistens TaxID=156977 RepID=A0ABU1SF38_9MICO|nr:glycerophosphodiester phosphodiesterase family protein [Microbacterium resistens]MDR6868209.1 glycerophosphoryl diester phosphodiesterase [Microbacterium resistens]
MTHEYLSGASAPRILAHRGLTTAPGGDPSVFDNSALAFAAAHAAGAEYVETDCRLTADGKVVLFHDETLERLLDDPRPLREVEAAELEERFAGRGGLLTLSDALESFPTLRFNVDVKERAAAEAAGIAVAPHAQRVLLTSFSDATRRAAVEAARRAGGVAPAASPGQRTIALLRLSSLLRSKALARRILREVDAIQVPERFGPIRVLTPALLRLSHAAGVEVHVWTVNEPTRMAELIDGGVDGIVTDRVDLAITTLGRR